MTATNHALTGAVIGLLVKDPIVAVPAAFLSHFVCDVLPHYGGSGKTKRRLKSEALTRSLKSNKFQIILLFDALLCLVIVGTLYGLKPHHWLLACACAFIATSPDLGWANMFIRAKLNKPWKPSLYSKFAALIQWFEKPIGAVVEVTWAFSAIVVLTAIIR